MIQIAEAIPCTSNQETNDATSLVGSNTPSFLMLPEIGPSNVEALSVYIPSDQMRMIENINILVSEVWSLDFVVCCKFFFWGSGGQTIKDF